MLDSPDWGVNVDLCDLVNSDFNHYGKDAVKALRAKIIKRNPPVQLLAGDVLSIVETCRVFSLSEV